MERLGMFGYCVFSLMLFFILNVSFNYVCRKPLEALPFDHSTLLRSARVRSASGHPFGALPRASRWVRFGTV